MQVESSSLLRAAPPGARPVVPPATQARPPEVRDEVELGSSSPLSFGSKALLGAMGMLSLAGPAWAGTGGAVAAAAAPVASQARVLETPAPQPPPGPLKLQASTVRDLMAPQDTVPKPKPAPSRDGERLDFGYTNDSFKDPMGLARARDRQPGTDYTDDNGWTAEIRGDWVQTRGDRQSVLSGRLLMATERGSWDPGPEYGGRRQDVVELAWQENFRRPLDERTSLHYGVGGGLQAVGPLGGRQVQEAWHRYAPFGGRIGEAEGLQYNYTTDHVTVSPLLTGGVGVVRRLDAAGDWEARGTLQAALPLGPGLGAVRAEAGLRGYPSARFTVDAGVNVTGAYTNGRALDFMELEGVRPGAHAGLEYQLTDRLRPFARVDVGGLRDEPVYTIGISFTLGGKGEKARLDPLWR